MRAVWKCGGKAVILPIVTAYVVPVDGICRRSNLYIHAVSCREGYDKRRKRQQSMIKKSKKFLALVMAAAMMSAVEATAQTAVTQNLLPMPRSINLGKGVFATAHGVTIDNAVGAETESVFTPEWARRAAVHGEKSRVLRYSRLEGAASPEAYRLHVVRDTMEISAVGRDGFMRAWQTVAQLSTS